MRFYIIDYCVALVIWQSVEGKCVVSYESCVRTSFKSTLFIVIDIREFEKTSILVKIERGPDHSEVASRSI